MDQNSDTEKSALDAGAMQQGAGHDEPAPLGDEQGQKKRKPWVALVIFAILATIIAWVAMIYNEYASFAASVAGLVASVAGAILVGKGTWRSTAITSAIASGVLVLVFGLLWAALSIIV